MLTIEPLRCSFMYLTACWAQMKELRTLTAKMPSHSSTVVFSMLPRLLQPTVLTSTSMRPKCATALSISARQSASTATSALSAIAWCPASTRLAATAWAASGERLETTTRAPSSANKRTMPSPMPEPEPVTTATLSLRRAIDHSLKEKLFIEGHGVQDLACRQIYTG